MITRPSFMREDELDSSFAGGFKASIVFTRDSAPSRQPRLITSAAIAETGGIAKAENGPDPRSMSLERCYEARS